MIEFGTMVFEICVGVGFMAWGLSFLNYSVNGGKK